MKSVYQKEDLWQNEREVSAILDALRERKREKGGPKAFY